MKAIVEYYGNLIELNRILYIIGLRSDEKADDIARKYTMAIVKMMQKAGYDIFNEEKTK